MSSYPPKALSLHIDKKSREGIELLKAAEARAEKGVVGDGEIAYKLAQAYAVLGDTQSALRSFRRSIEQGFFCYPYFVNDPLIKTLRGGSEHAKSMEIARKRHEEFKRRFS